MRVELAVQPSSRISTLPPVGDEDILVERLVGVVACK